MAILVLKGEPYPRSLLHRSIINSVPPYFLILILLMLPPIFKINEVREARALFQGKMGSCCSFPCQNGGICVESCSDYSCDCTGTHHYGRNCQYEMLMTKLVRYNHALWHTLDRPLGLRKIVDSFDFLHSFFYGTLVKTVVEGVQEPRFSSSHGGFSNQIFNSCSEVLLLSPVPTHCPTPLGMTGFHILPPLESLFDLVLKRSGTMPTSKGKINLLFVAYGQFLAKQMSCTNNVNWLGSSAMYGNFQRTHCRGKVSKGGTADGQCCHGELKDIYHVSIMSDALQNIIILEHNRVCDILYDSHPSWSDQRIYETATQIVTGEVITITSNEWLPFLKDYGMRMKFKSPYTSIISNKVPYEVILALFWPQMYPDSLSIGGSNIDLEVLSSGGVESLPRGGTFELMKTLAATCPGMMGPKNIPPALEEKTRKLILEGRRRNFQSFNNYRISLGLGRCKSFEELTGDSTVLVHLQKMYGDVDGLELIPGLLLEAPRSGMILGDTMSALISDLIFKAVVTHPLTTTSYLKKSTFGGNRGWEMVKNANIKTLICQNVNEGCSKDVELTFGKKKCKEESPCGKKKVQDKAVQKPPPKKICGLPDKLFSPPTLEEKDPKFSLSEDPPSSTMSGKTCNTPPKVEKLPCPLSKKTSNPPPKVEKHHCPLSKKTSNPPPKVEKQCPLSEKTSMPPPTVEKQHCTLSEKTSVPPPNKKKQHCPFKNPSRPFNKPKPKPVDHSSKEATCPKSPPPEAKQPPPVKRCCIRRPWFRTKK